MILLFPFSTHFLCIKGLSHQTALLDLWTSTPMFFITPIARGFQSIGVLTWVFGFFLLNLVTPPNRKGDQPTLFGATLPFSQTPTFRVSTILHTVIGPRNIPPKGVSKMSKFQNFCPDDFDDFVRIGTSCFKNFLNLSGCYNDLFGSRICGNSLSESLFLSRASSGVVEIQATSRS